jgi:hypothetical protein
MYIYKITVVPLSQCYIGLDTKPVYKKFRWKDHCREAKKLKSQRKIHRAMREYGIENCQYEVLKDGFTSFGELALAEIDYIKLYDSYANGLNSSPGGDGLGIKGWDSLTDQDILDIKFALGEKWREWNSRKWHNTTPEQRKEMIKNAHTPEVNKRRTQSLKEFYAANPNAKKAKGASIIEWQKNNRQKLIEQNKKNSLKGAEKVSIAIMVEFPDGKQVNYPSKSEFHRQTGLWPKTIIEKTIAGQSHHGYKAWEIQDE